MTLVSISSSRLAFFVLGLTCSLSCSRLTGRELPTQEREEARAVPREEEAPPKPAPPQPLDKGIFSDLDAQITLRCPPWLAGGPHLAVHSKKTGRTWLAVDGVIICEAPRGSSTAPPGSVEETATLTLDETPQDEDQDGIPDAVDILRGAKKAARNGAIYKNNYRPLTFPGGDVPREEGVCTDVVIRSLRNSGRDLQELLALDIAARRDAYPMVKDPDPNIDHRRVRTLLPYFEYAFESLPKDPRDSSSPFLPGDIVFMNTMGDLAPEHLGVVSDDLGDSGLPLIINNWTDGTVTRAMDLLRTVPVTHRFRATLPIRPTSEQIGLAGVLKRNQLALPEKTRQILLVTTPLWSSTGGTMRRYVREGEALRQVGEPVQIRVGERGLAKGRGLPTATPRGLAEKREGDKKAPAGMFDLGTAFGRPQAAPYKGNSWPYRPTTANDLWIDDPKSPKYNQWITIGAGETQFGSAENLQMYTLGLVVEHNTKDTIPGAGSAIFLHPWRDSGTPTVGCTALPEGDLKEILAWLDQEATPVLIQLAEHVF